MFLGTWNYNSKHSFLKDEHKISLVLKTTKKQRLFETTVWQKEKYIFSFMSFPQQPSLPIYTTSESIMHSKNGKCSIPRQYFCYM